MWQLSDLAPLLSEHDGWQVELQGQALLIRNEDNIEAFLAVSGEQILVEVVLFDAAQVKDTDALNREVLRTHKLFPLSTIGLNTINDNDYYIAFGSLSSQSKAESVVIEVATLFRNVEAFIDLYQDHFKEQTA